MHHGVAVKREGEGAVFHRAAGLHAEDGVDFVTLHCGITKKTIEQIKKHKRKDTEVPKNYIFVPNK